MSGKKLGVAIVGCGSIGQTHSLAVSEFDELEIVALVDDVESAAVAQAERLTKRGIRRPQVYNSLSDALSDTSVDMVVLGTPSGLHEEQAIASLKAGKHVVIEKPIGVDLKTAKEIQKVADEAAKRGQVASVISQHRFDPAARIVSEALEAGRFGRVTSAIASVAWWRSQGYYDSGSWRGTWSMDGGGALMNQGVHTVDLLVWLLGQPVEVSAHTSVLVHDRIEVEDTAVATVTFASGALAVLHATTAAYPGMTARLQLMGSKGSAVIDGDDDRLTYLHLAGEGDQAGAMGIDGDGNQAGEALARVEVSDEMVITDHITNPTSHVRQYKDILHAIHTGTQPGVTVADGIRDVALVDAVYVSSVLGGPVQFDDVLSGKYLDLPLTTPGA